MGPTKYYHTLCTYNLNILLIKPMQQCKLVETVGKVVKSKRIKQCQKVKRYAALCCIN